jgi:phosphoribosylformylglycinamidine (FGAM) synthase-like enzyme
VGEMGSETGVRIDLDSVPLKDKSLTAWEILLSESQERMLLAVPPEKVAEARPILERYEVGYSVLGHFTNTGHLEAIWRGQKVVDLEMAFLWEACPIDPLQVARPQRDLQPLRISEPHTEAEWAAAMRGVLGHYHCADQSAAGCRFDTTVQGRTAVGPYGGKNHRMPTNVYISAPLRGKPYGLITTLAFNPFYGEIDPAGLARLMIIEAITKAVAAGADYRQMVLCDNFYTPRVRPEIAWDLRAMVETIADMSLALGVPFISGKDSSSGTFETEGRRIDVPATLVVAAMGRLPDVRKVASKDFKRPGNRLILVGRLDCEALGGSVYADSCGQRGDRLFDAYDASSIRSLWEALLRLHGQDGYVSASAIAEGGILLRLFEASWGSGYGARITLDALSGDVGARHGVPLPSPQGRKDGAVFGEFVGSALLEVPPECNLDGQLGDVPYRVIGEVLPDPQLILLDREKVVWQETTAAIGEVWSKTFREVIE